jgi:hypothetical protein
MASSGMSAWRMSKLRRDYLVELLLYIVLWQVSHHNYTNLPAPDLISTNYNINQQISCVQSRVLMLLGDCGRRICL